MTTYKFFRNYFISSVSLVLISFAQVWGQSYDYEISWTNPETHFFTISLSTPPDEGPVSIFQIPAWRPGRYELMNYASGITDFHAEDESGVALSWKKTGINDWQVENPSSGKIIIIYQFYANVMDAGSSVLSHEQAYINGVNLFMHIKDQYQRPCTLSFTTLPVDWKIATALKPESDKAGSFSAPDYHTLVDSPIISSATLRSLHFEEAGVNYNIHFQGVFGAGEEGEKAIVENTRQMIREESALFGGVPFEEYHFLFQFVPEMIGHAVEHGNSSCYVLGAAFVSDSKRFNILYNVIGHEFFHLWNVKRIRPETLWPYDYQHTPFTGLHWFTEGVTSYYADLILVRSGIYSHESYYGSLQRIINQMENNYAEKVISPYQASLDSWLSGSAYQHPDFSISYYSLGHRLGLYLDLTLRARTDGKTGLDDVFLYLYKRHYEQGKGVPENGIQVACENLTGSSFESFFNAYVNGTERMDLEKLFGDVGLQITSTFDPAAGLENLGIRGSNTAQDTLTVGRILPGTDASASGLKEGAKIISINGKPLAEQSLKDHLESAPVPSELSFKIAGDPEPVKVTWTGKQNHYRYSIKENPDATSQQIDIREQWMRSKQNHK